jgi:hypothetical protein
MSHDLRVFDVGGQRSLVRISRVVSKMFRLNVPFFREPRGFLISTT